MERNLILQGWLIKSPPENKSAGPFKLFKAKWRKRFFVLYEPLASESLPGTRAALDYYSNEKYQKKLGTIDLDHCDNVVVKLDSNIHKHVFSLRTKHKGRDRNYYLAVATEQEMMKWVDCLCLALGLKENPDDVSQSQQAPLAPQTIIPPQRTSPASLRGLPAGRYVDDPSDSTPPAVHTPQPNGNATNHVNHGSTRTPPSELPHQKSEQYIPLVDCYTGERHSVGMGDKTADHRASVDSIPPEPPPAPPVKTGRKLSDLVSSPVDPSLYDSPTRSYVNLDDNENVYKIPRGEGEGVYKIPRGDDDGVYKMPRGMDDVGLYKVPRGDREQDQEGLYNIPRGDPVDQEGVYNIPRGDPVDQQGLYNIPRSDPVDDEGLYNVPRSDRIVSSSSDLAISNDVHRRTVDVPADGVYNIPRGDPVIEDAEGVYKLPRLRTAEDDEGIYKMPLPAQRTDHQPRDVSVFSQVPLHGAGDVMSGSVMSQRYSPDGEPSPGDEWYDVPSLPPPPRPVRHSNSSNDSHTGLSSHSPDGSSGTGDLYDVPKNMSHLVTADSRTSTLGKAGHELYDAPKSCRKTVSENNLLESVVPAPALSQPTGPDTPFIESRYENLPPKVFEDSTFPRISQKSSQQQRPTRSNSSSSQYYNTQPVFDDLYDIPPPQSHMNDADKIIQSPPPPRLCQSAVLHSYVNAPVSYMNDINDDTNPSVVAPPPHGHESFYMPMAAGGVDPRESVLHKPVSPTVPVVDTMGDVYTDMFSVQGTDMYNRRAPNPSVHDVVPPPSKAKVFAETHGEDTYIIQTHRTRSFKRPMPHLNMINNHSSAEVVLPTRRTGMSEDITSSDEESTSSGSHHDKSLDNINYRPQNYPKNPSLGPKIGSLNCTPPAPKRPGEVQYLDLALEEQSDAEKSPLCIRTPAPGNASPTDYKEIDFIKTKALNETQRDVESKRKSSERSMDE